MYNGHYTVDELGPDLIKYLEKSGDSGIRRNPDNVVVRREQGFCVYRVVGRRFIIVALYSKDGTFWNDFTNGMAKQMNCDTIFFTTQRDPKAFIRRYGFKIAGYVMTREVK